MTKQRVLVPLDGSGFSCQVLPYLREFLDPTINEIIFLRVATNEDTHILTPKPPQQVASEWQHPAYNTHRDAHLAKHPVYANQIRDSLQAALAEDLRHCMNKLRQVGYDVSITIKFGDPAQKILDFIKTEQIDLVAMTTHGRTGLGRMIFGSVAEKVLHKISVPILLLRPMKGSIKKLEVSGYKHNFN